MTAGVSCSGPRGRHGKRLWCVAPGRCLTWRDGDFVRTIDVPFPGTAPVLDFDAFREMVLLENGDTWRFDGHGSMWRPGAPIVKEEEVKTTKAGPALIAGGSCCGVFWVATPDRQIWTWTPNGRAPLVEAPVPGEARILAVDLSHKTVVLEGGERYEWLTRGWCPMPGLLETKATILVRCLEGIRLASGDFFPGELREVSEREAREMIAVGRAEAVFG